MKKGRPIAANLSKLAKQIREIKKLDSRWVTIFRTAPMCVMHEKGIFILNKNI